MAVDIYTADNPPPSDMRLVDDECNELSIGCVMQGYADSNRVVGELFAVKVFSGGQIRYGLVVSEPKDYSGHDLGGLLRDTDFHGRGWWVVQDLHLISDVVEVNIPEKEIEYLFDF